MTLHYTTTTTTATTATTLLHTTLHQTTLHYTTLHYTTLHRSTQHYSTIHYSTLHYTVCTTPQLQLQLQLQLHYTNYTTWQLQLHYTTLQLQLQLHYTTLHPAVVVRWPLQPLRPLQKHSSNHRSVHQWIRSAIRDSQQPTSPIGFLSLKLSPPPCAVLLVLPSILGIIMIQ